MAGFIGRGVHGDFVADAATLNGIDSTGFELADLTILKDADLGVTIQAYDVDTLKADLTDNLIVGYTTDVEVLGSDTIAPDMATECIKTRVMAGNLTVNFPVGGNGVCHIMLDAGVADRTITLGANVKSVGVIPTLTATKVYLMTVIRDTATHAVVQVQEVSA